MQTVPPGLKGTFVKGIHESYIGEDIRKRPVESSATIFGNTFYILLTTNGKLTDVLKFDKNDFTYVLSGIPDIKVKKITDDLPEEKKKEVERECEEMDKLVTRSPREEYNELIRIGEWKRYSWRTRGKNHSNQRNQD